MGPCFIFLFLLAFYRKTKRETIIWVVPLKKTSPDSSWVVLNITFRATKMILTGNLGSSEQALFQGRLILAGCPFLLVKNGPKLLGARYPTTSVEQPPFLGSYALC